MSNRIIATVFTLALTVVPATHAQFGGIVFDPTQAGHAIQQISQGVQLYTTAQADYQQAIATYNFARQMMTAPQQLYQQWRSPSTYWRRLVLPNGTYNTAPQDYFTAGNTGMGVNNAIQQVSIPGTIAIDGYGELSVPGQQQIAAQGATVDMSDAANANTLQTLGTIRSNSIKREGDLSALENASHTTDAAQLTELSTLQRMNQATLLQIRAQQDTNQINQQLALQQMISQKQQQDAMKAAFRDANGYANYFNTNVIPITLGADYLLTHSPY
ncbi:MAG: hypothetical protein ABI383_04945 [Acidobacteriaceae bacterium]